MPSRLVVLAIMLFWVGAMCWLVMREIAPSWRAGEPPAIVFEVADEISANTIDWSVHDESGEIGSGQSRVKALPGRTYELFSEFKFQKKDLLGVLRKIGTTYHVTDDGRLLDLDMLAHAIAPFGGAYELQAIGKVEGSQLSFEVFLDKQKLSVPLKPIRLDGHRQLLNPMHLVNKVAGLYPGRTWSIPLLDPSEAINVAVLDALASSGNRRKKLIAEVVAAELPWPKTAGEMVPCFRIDYAPPGEKIVASTWVRQRDGLVLQQEAQLLAHTIKLRREPGRN